jgi:hypothetical protein
MNKLIAALVAVLVTGAAGFTVAQEAPKPASPKLKIVEREDAESVEAVLLDESDVFVQRAPKAELRYVNVQHNQAGTWQIVNVNNIALLLNTATGDTFSLEKGDEGLHWKPVLRPAPEKQPFARLALPQLPRLEKDASPKRDEANELREIEEAIEGLRKRHDESDSVKEREKIERAIKELKEKAEDLRKERRTK